MEGAIAPPTLHRVRKDSQPTFGINKSLSVFFFLKRLIARKKNLYFIILSYLWLGTQRSNSKLFKFLIFFPERWYKEFLLREGVFLSEGGLQKRNLQNELKWFVGNFFLALKNFMRGRFSPGVYPSRVSVLLPSSTYLQNFTAKTCRLPRQLLNTLEYWFNFREETLNYLSGHEIPFKWSPPFFPGKKYQFF